MKTILVTGATGNVGSALVSDLLGAGHAVRAAVPNAETGAARDRFSPEVDVGPFAFEREEYFEDALSGADGLFLMRPPHISAVRQIMAPAIERAAETKPHIVVLSVLGAGSNPLVPHHAMEKLVKRSGAPYTLLRPSFFMQNLSTNYREDIARRGEISVPAGRGRTSFIDVRDIAEIAGRVMLEPAHMGRAYSLTGAEALDYHEVASVFTEVLGRLVRYRNPSPREFARRLAAEGVAPDYAKVLRGIYLTARIGLAARVTADAENLLGRPPRSLEEFVRDHAAIWSDDDAGVDQAP